MGYEHYIPVDGDPEGVAIATVVNTRLGSRRLLEYAFEHAIAQGRKKIAVVHKANIMKILTGIFLEEARKLHRDKYAKQIEMQEVIVDACAMKLVLNPWQFATIVTTHLFGDILSDLVAGQIGSATCGARVC